MKAIRDLATYWRGPEFVKRESSQKGDQLSKARARNNEESIDAMLIWSSS